MHSSSNLHTNVSEKKMAFIALFPLLMIGVLVLVFSMILDESHLTHHDTIQPIQVLDAEELLAA